MKDPLFVPQQHKLMSIQYIRALAAVAVVVWHTGWSRTVLGQSGVDAFLVVSGFIMMLVSGREDSPAKFGLSRVLRIVPLYWTVTLGVAWLDRPSGHYLASSLLFWPAYRFPVVIQGWSLNLEMMYYFLFGISLWAHKRWRVPILAGQMVLLCIVLPGLFCVSRPVSAWADPLAFEFLGGAVLFLLWRRRWLPVGAAGWVVLISGVASLASTHLLGKAPAGWHRVVFWGLPAVAIVTGGLGVEASGQLPKLRFLGVLGDSSYAIYLTHYVVLRYLAGPLHYLWAPLAVTLVVVAACLIGWVVHRGFELPMHRAGKRVVAALSRKRRGGDI